MLIHQHRKIMNYPLRRKLISDISNILLFLITFWYSYEFFNRKLLFISLIVYSLFLMLYSSRFYFNKIIIRRIGFGTNLLQIIKQSLKMKGLPYKGSTIKSDYDTTHNQTSYRECMVLTVIWFCKSVLISFSFLLIFFNILYFESPDEFKALKIFITIDNPLTNLFILLNNAGLLFSIYKFLFDKKAIKREKSDNARYLEIVKRLDRNEHSI